MNNSTKRLLDMVANDKLSHSLEDYLETIYLIVREQGSVRSRDIAQRIGVTPASVTEALRALDSRGLIHYVPYTRITLTQSGEERAREVLHRHETLRDFFIEVLNVAPQIADSSACRIEHVISDEILDSMITYTNTVRRNNLGVRGTSPMPVGTGKGMSAKAPH